MSLGTSQTALWFAVIDISLKLVFYNRRWRKFARLTPDRAKQSALVDTVRHHRIDEASLP